LSFRPCSILTDKEKDQIVPVVSTTLWRLLEKNSGGHPYTAGGFVPGKELRQFLELLWLTGRR